MITLTTQITSQPVLREGSTGQSVRELQEMLTTAGFNPGSIDGNFGTNTKAAVIAFQGTHKLGVDGIVGPQTWAALNAAISQPPSSSTGVTTSVLRAIMPNLSQERANACLPHMNRAMAEARINTRLRIAAFLAQLAHESGELRYFEELASGAAYEGRADLGNTQPGDGRRYKGRGPIQLTGRSNYRAAGAALGLDLEGQPTRAADLDVGFRVAGWFWTSRGLNPLADAGNFKELTRRINGGYNGMSSRERYYQRALSLL